MGIPIQYAYLTGTGFFVVIWIVLYAFLPKVRKEMLVLSLLSSVLGFSQLMFTQDYWHPLSILGTGRIDIESFILSFCYGGVAAPLHELFFGQGKPAQPYRANLRRTGIALVVALAAVFVGVYGFGWNSIYVTSAVLLFLGAAMIREHPLLLNHAVITGLLFAFFMYTELEILNFLFPNIISMWWNLPLLSGFFVGNVPVEELLSAFSWGFFAGPISEFSARIQFKSRRTR